MIRPILTPHPVQMALQQRVLPCCAPRPGAFSTPRLGDCQPPASRPLMAPRELTPRQSAAHAGTTQAPATPPTDPRWPQLALRLTQLARTLTQDPRLSIAAAERWSYNVNTHQLEVPAETLLAGDDAFVLGATCRWVGRRLYSRRVEAAELQQAPFALLWAALEDARTGRLLGARLAGVPRLLGAFYQGFLAAAESGNRASTLIASLLREGALLQPRRHPEDAALDALLARARPILERAVALPVDLDWGTDELTEDEANAACAAAFAVVRDELWPLLAEVLKQLETEQVPDDVAEQGGDVGAEGKGDGAPGGAGKAGGQGGKATADGGPEDASEGGESGDTDADGDFGDGDRASKKAPGRASKAGGRLTPKTAEELRDLLDAGQDVDTLDGVEALPTEAEMLERKGTVGHAGTSDDVSFAEQIEALEESVRRDVSAKTQYNPYEALRARHAQAIEDMVAHLGNALAREEAPKYTGHAKRGRLHMGRFIQSQLREEHTGVSDPNVFQRRDEPDDRSVAVVACIDTSGSMHGANMEAARAAFVVLQEALSQLAIPSASMAFDDSPLLLQPLGMHDEPSRHKALATLRAGGGNNEPAALKLASETLEDSDAAHKVVLFLTDGGAVRDCKACVERTEREIGMKVIGIGIGAGCGEVPHIYASHVVVPVVGDLPLKMADVLREALAV